MSEAGIQISRKTFIGNGSLCNNLPDLKIAAQFQSEQLRKPNYDADSKLHSAWARNPNYYARFHSLGQGFKLLSKLPYFTESAAGPVIQITN